MAESWQPGRPPEPYPVPPAEEPVPPRPPQPLFYQDGDQLPVVSHGRGIYLWDEQGRRYLDGCSGAMAAALGHAHPRLQRAAAAQLERVAFAYRKQFESRPANELASLLAQLSPPGLDRVFFVNSGSEAVETAIKLARQHWWTQGRRGKVQVVAASPSYHGATLGALAVTEYAPLNIPFQGLVQDQPKVAAPFCYHCPRGMCYPACELACAWELERTIHIKGAENIAAFIVEPIGGASTGAAVPPDEYLPLIADICRSNDILLIVDDVLAGCGRTGTFYGYSHWDVTPDIVAVSKGLSGGYGPIGAIIARHQVVEPVLAGDGFMHGHTYAGNPLSTALALEAVRTILDEGLIDNARETGIYLHERLHGLRERHAVVGDVRGRGLLAALELVRDRDRRMPFPPDWFVAHTAAAIARRRGLLIYPRRSMFGLTGDHFLVAPPLVIDRAGVDELVGLVDEVLIELEDRVAGYVRAASPEFEAQTHRRYRPPEQVPDYAVGDLSQRERIEGANATGIMQLGYMSPLRDGRTKGNGGAG
jgi:adenosylmethionine-8-amino-7-oxononanoate aminotransferase